MKSIKVLDKTFVPFLSADDISAGIDKVAEKMTAELADKNPLILVILNGSFMFASDLVRKLDFPLELSFVRLSSYAGTASTNKVRELIGLDRSLWDRHVVILEDIIDTGNTMSYIMEKFSELGVADVKIATLLYKPDAYQGTYDLDYVGIEIPNDFIVGYGLDYDGYGRNLPDIWTIKE